MTRVVTSLTVPVACEFPHVLSDGVRLVVLGCLAVFALQDKLTLFALPSNAGTPETDHAFKVGIRDLLRLLHSSHKVAQF